MHLYFDHSLGTTQLLIQLKSKKVKSAGNRKNVIDENANLAKNALSSVINLVGYVPPIPNNCQSKKSDFRFLLNKTT